MPDNLAAVQEPSAAPAPPLPLRRPLLVLTVGASVALTFVLVWYLYNILLGPNFGVVIPGRIYRGSQPSPAALEALVERYNVRTIVNLRGCCEPHPWYHAQTRVVQRLGISQEDVCFSAVHLPSADELRILVETFEHAEYPVFLHCRQGADRTGLAAAVALLLQDNVPYADARGQLCLAHGHLAVSRTAHIDRFFDLYERWLFKQERAHSPAAFRQWVLVEYKGGPCNSRIESVERLADVRAGRPLGFRVRVRNLSDHAWQFKPTATAGMHLYFQVWDDAGNGVAEGRAGLMEKILEPGESLDVTLVVPPLPRPGRYRLFVDMVEEYHCWFYQTGTEPWEEELHVRE